MYIDFYKKKQPFSVVATFVFGKA